MKDTLAMEEWLKMNESHNYSKPNDEETKAYTEPIIKAGKDRFAKNITVNDEGEEVEEGGGSVINNIHDLLADSRVWQQAGIGFGDYDTMLL
jgi:hypothetical protein